MSFEQNEFLNLADISIEDFVVLLIGITLLTGLSMVIARRNVKRRQVHEIPLFMELMSNTIIGDFFSLLDTCNLKLRLYRSLYNVNRTLSEFHQRVKSKVPHGRESGLIRILSQQISLSQQVLYSPQITHLLFDTERIRISKKGMEELRLFRSQFNRSLQKYGKTLQVNKDMPFFQYAKGPQKKRIPRTAPILIMK